MIKEKISVIMPWIFPWIRSGMKREALIKKMLNITSPSKNARQGIPYPGEDIACPLIPIKKAEPASLKTIMTSNITERKKRGLFSLFMGSFQNYFIFFVL
jgi:hypothetical protein